jgi:hypothetical protein
MSHLADPVRQGSDADFSEFFKKICTSPSLTTTREQVSINQMDTLLFNLLTPVRGG